MKSKIIFGQMVDFFRKENNLTMEELGSKLGKTKSSISRWIKGERYPKIEEIEEIARFFNTDIETLVFGFNKDEKIINDITDMKNNFFASNLKYLRTQKGLEQKDISELLGLKSPTSITNWEKGTNLARAGHLLELASFFDVSLHDLMEKDLSSVDDSHNITILYDQLNPARKAIVYDFVMEQLKGQNNEM